MKNSKNTSSLERERLKRWSQAGAAVIVIYVSAFFAIPVAWKMINTFNMGFVMTGLLLALSGFFARDLWRYAKQYRQQRLILAGLLIVAFAVQFYHVSHRAKQYHLIEYPFLTFLIYRALRIDFENSFLWFGVFALSLAVGLGDEVLQYFIPERVPSWADIGMNIKGTVFALIFIAITDAGNRFRNEPRDVSA